MLRILKRRIKTELRKRGVELRLMPIVDQKINGLSYTRVETAAGYAPWLDEPAFVALMNSIRDSTLVDELRCWELWQLVPQCARLPGEILEVGVWRGGTGAIIASRAPNKIVYLADTFGGVPKAGERDPHYGGGEHSETSVEAVEELLGTLGVSNAVVLKGIFPEEFPQLSNVYCFVHIDVDVYESARAIMDEIWPRLSPGGMVVFDDYGFHTTSGIAHLVNGYVGDPDKLVIHNFNGHALIIKAWPAGRVASSTPRQAAALHNEPR
jgi:O-methyltransferase